MKKAKIPGPRERRWWSWIVRETTHSILELAIGLIGATLLLLKSHTERDRALSELRKVSAGAKAAVEEVERVWAWSFWPALVVLILVALKGAWKLWAAYKKDSEELDSNDPQHLLGPLRVLHGLVCERKNIKNDDADRERFRVTLHRHIEGQRNGKDSSGKHQQCVPYVGGKTIEPAKVVGRTWPNSHGIVGKAIRAGGKSVKQFVSAEGVTSEAEYYQELSDLFGYDQEEVRKLQPLRLSSIAIPIVCDDAVIGVVYCDSSERDFFDKDTIALCVQISTAVAQHIHLTY